MENQNPVLLFVRNEPLIAFVLIAMSLIAVAFIGERLIAFRDFGNTGGGVFSEILKRAREGNDGEAMRLALSQKGPVTGVSEVILKNANRPVADVERLVQEAGEEYFHRLGRFLPILDTITTLSPLWGLFGTIVGMIQVFVNYTKARDDVQKSAILPSVGTALYATAGGILIALVCFVAYNYFAARRERIIAETELAATKLINVLSARGAFKA
jgi:biopolymer transport protein ExbB